MNPTFTDEQLALRDTVGRFLSEKAPLPHVRELLDDPVGTTDEVWKGLAQLASIFRDDRLMTGV
ncbi:hypothetical protein H7I77_01790 [Mycolicibacterium novocastrense]|uniref:Acyl-CoA dehydrogenase n=1 Tax=Mycolicibacterium novocastrense TaxID=59813 RepID=A0AAW5SE99_MYCNV|nr:hypothetical protein [Mycolicibacterium novocastrense]GAT11851.1 acyl-CoA dehydrogenase [Mycolicibacterium novocastrense]